MASKYSGRYSTFSEPTDPEFFETGLVRRFPTAILASGMVLTGLLAVSVGLILNTLMRSFRDMHYKISDLERRSNDRL
jgi:hypothetical protein